MIKNRIASQNNKLLSDWLGDLNFYSPNFLKKRAEIISEANDRTLKLFHSASSRVPAYKDFLSKQKINVSAIKNISDFVEVPVITKENYIQNYEIGQRCWDGDLSRMHMISTSSGTTGQPHFWPRDLQAEIAGAYAHEYILKEILSVGRKKTLFIDGFAMGNWIAGTFTQACTSLLAWKGLPLSIMTPGYSSEEIIKILLNISKEFDQTIIAGHTPFLKELIELAIDSGVDFGKIKTKLLGTGQGITENWRAYILKLLQSDDSEHSFLNLYGSADAALMGFETADTIEIRKNLTQGQIAHLFNDERLPSIYAYDPRLTFFEQESEELLITKDSGCPLIRYNIHDKGGICPGSLNKKKASLPMIYMFGREKFMVKIFGANIYTEHVLHALNHPKLQTNLTGRFVMESIINENQNPQLLCRVELVQGKNIDDGLEKIVQKIFISEVRKINSEYNFVLGEMGQKVWPKISLHQNGDVKYFPKGTVKKSA